MSYVKLSNNLYYGIHPSIVYPPFHIDYIIDLTEKHDYYTEKIISIPIPDKKTPNIWELHQIINFLLSLKGIIYIACKESLGPSATIAAILYGKEKHFSGLDTIKYINQEWYKQKDLTKLSDKIKKLGCTKGTTSPLTKIQKDLIKEYLDNPIYFNTKIKIIYGDLIQLANNYFFDIIIHGCNCFNTMGAGIALSIKKEFPEAYKADLETIKGDKNKLGTFTSIYIPKYLLTIINAYTQYNWGGKGIQCDYKAIDQVFKKIYDKYGKQNKKFGIPLIGCGLAGGDYKQVLSIIEKNMPNENITLVIFGFSEIYNSIHKYQIGMSNLSLKNIPSSLSLALTSSTVENPFKGPDGILGTLKDPSGTSKKYWKTILFYQKKDPYFFLSNFYKYPFMFNNEKWLFSEGYFQAMKFRGPYASPKSIEYSNIIREADSPNKIYLLGKQKKGGLYKSKYIVNKLTDRRTINSVIDLYKDVKIRPDWEKIKIHIMIDVVVAKFSSPKLKSQIINIPDNTLLVEHTPLDKIWGDGNDGGDETIGKNYLGKILTVLHYVLKYGSCNIIPQPLKIKIKIQKK
jgi:ribA/ribD-fused uncharacterized protein